MTLWDHACCFGYGIQARLNGIWHLVRGHDVKWRTDVDLWLGCTGDIVCDDCQLSIWSRHYLVIEKAAELLCGLLGHPSWRHPKYLIDADSEWEDESQWQTVPTSVCCTRCGLWFNEEKQPH